MVPEALVNEIFVVVTLVEVTLPKLPFQRRADEPRANCASNVGIKLVTTRFETAKLVVVTLVAAKLVVVTLVAVPFTKVKPCNEVLPKTVKVEVTVEEAPTKPPKS